jgi:hypothetical protein
VYDLLVQIAAEGTAVPRIEQNRLRAVEITRRAQQDSPVLLDPDRELADDPWVVASHLGARAEPGQIPPA